MLKGFVTKALLLAGIIRLPNIIIILFNLLLLRYWVVIPLTAFYSNADLLSVADFLLLAYSISITAVIGYLCNDYYDYEIDLINKPAKVYINKTISRKQILLILKFLNGLASLTFVLLAYMTNAYLPFVLLIVALAVVWWYAARLKKSFLWGNIAVACMSAFTIPLYFIAEGVVYLHPINISSSALIQNPILWVMIAFTSFAFLLSLIREIVKDMEDVEGDKKMNCITLPIKKGSKLAKRLIILFSILTVLLLLCTITVLYNYSFTLACIWLIAAVLLPLLFFIEKLRRAEHRHEYHSLSNLLKIIMLGGILTILTIA